MNKHPKGVNKTLQRVVVWSYPVLDAVAELVESESAVGKTAVCGPNSSSVRPMFIFTGRIQQQHRFGGVFRACVSACQLLMLPHPIGEYHYSFFAFLQILCQ